MSAGVGLAPAMAMRVATRAAARPMQPKKPQAPMDSPSRGVDHMQARHSSRFGFHVRSLFLPLYVMLPGADPEFCRALARPWVGPVGRRAVTGYLGRHNSPSACTSPLALSLPENSVRFKVTEGRSAPSHIDIREGRSFAMEGDPRHEDCWAKTTEDGQPGISVRDHCLNVGCVAEALAGRAAARCPTLAALHDVGKVSPGFQRKCEPWLVQHGLRDRALKETWSMREGDHAKVSQYTVQGLLGKSKALSLGRGTWSAPRSDQGRARIDARAMGSRATAIGGRAHQRIRALCPINRRTRTKQHSGSWPA